MTSFSDLGLSPEVLQAVADAGYTEPTPIQAQAIPIVLTGANNLMVLPTMPDMSACATPAKASAAAPDRRPNRTVFNIGVSSLEGPVVLPFSWVGEAAEL